MSVGRYSRLNYHENPISMYVPRPFETLDAIGQRTQKASDTRDAIKADILGKQVNALPQDYQGLAQAKKEVESKLSEFGDKNFNDPQVKSDWNKTQRELASRFGPQGDIGSIENNYNEHQTYMKGLNEALKKGPKEGGIDEDQYNKLKHISLNKYSGIGDLTNDGYSKYSGITPASYVDIAKHADDLAKGWKENKILTEGWKEDANGQLFRKRGNSTEYINDTEVYDAIKPILENDPMNKAYAKQNTLLSTYGTGATPEQIQNHYNSIFERPAKYVADKYGYNKTEYTEDIQQNQDYLQNAKHRLENPILNVGIEVQAPSYGTTTNDSKSLNTSAETLSSTVKGELSKILSITPGLLAPGGTPDGFIVQLDKQYPGGSIKWLKDHMNNIPEDRRDMVKGLVSNYDDVQQRTKDAEEYALGKVGTVHIQASKDLEKLAIKYGIDFNKASELLTSKVSGSDKGANFYDQMYANNPHAQEFRKEFNKVTDKVNKYTEAKDKYLKDTSSKKVTEQWADSVISPIAYDETTGQYTKDDKYGEKLTTYINTLLKDGSLNGLSTDQMDKGNVPKNLAQVIQENNPNPDDKTPAQPTRVFFTRLPGTDGKRQLVVQVGDKEVKINSDQIQVPDKSGKTVNLSEIQNDPIQKLNERVYRAYSNGVNKVSLSDGTNITLPQDIDGKGVMNGTYANSSNLKVDLSKDEQAKWGEKNLVGSKAVKYLLMKNAEASAKGTPLF